MTRKRNTKRDSIKKRERFKELEKMFLKDRQTKKKTIKKNSVQNKKIFVFQ